MRRLMLSCAGTACVVLAVGCGSDRTAKSNENTGANAPAAAKFRDNASDRPAPTDVSGCLTASGDRYVLTSLEPVTTTGGGPTRNENANAPGAPPVPTTETYQLIGGSPAELHKYVGQQVHVTGEADPARVAELRESTPPVGTSGAERPGPQQPKVSTEETTRVELRKLRVSSITGAGGPCSEARPAPSPAR
jgi:hypothetical protein